MIHRRLLTKEEMQYIDSIKLFTARTLAASDFRKLNDIRNDAYNVSRRAVIGCGACARDLIQHLKDLYFLSEEHFKQQEDASTSTSSRIQEGSVREQQGQTQGSSEQDNEGDKGSVSKAPRRESPKPKQVAGRGRGRRPRKSTESNAQTKRVHPPKAGETGTDS